MNIKQCGFKQTKIAGILCSAVLLGASMMPAHAAVTTVGDGDSGFSGGEILAETSDVSTALSTAVSSAAVGDSTTLSSAVVADSVVLSTAVSTAVVADSVVLSTAVVADSVVASTALSSATSNADDIRLIDTDPATGQVNVNTATIGEIANPGTLNVVGDATFVDGTDQSTSLAITDTGIVARTGDGATSSELSLQDAQASLTVDNGTSSHGLVVGTTSTTLSGGSNSSQIILDDSGAHFSSDTGGTFDMGGNQITNVADGVLATDAVNLGQLDAAVNGLQKQIDDNTSGIASVAAMANIPAPLPGHNYSMGVGYGNFQGEQAIAFGATAMVGERVNLKLSAGVSGSDVTSGAGAGMSWKQSCKLT